jgi:hypothetical protein
MKVDERLTADEYPQHKNNGRMSVEACLFYWSVMSKSVTAGSIDHSHINFIGNFLGHRFTSIAGFLMKGRSVFNNL